jgi:hypothetical protein
MNMVYFIYLCLLTLRIGIIGNRLNCELEIMECFKTYSFIMLKVTNVMNVLLAGFEKRVLEYLVKLKHDVNQLKKQLDHNTAMLQEIHGNPQDCEPELPAGLHMPMTSDDDINAMENALNDAVFKKQLVCKLCNNSVQCCLFCTTS